MSETVLVTGGRGFVAGWCIVKLLEQGHDVRATVRDLSQSDAVRAAIATQVDPDERLTLAAADLLSDDGWDDAVAGCDFVLHVASPLGIEQPSDVDALIAPARDGALRVLRASVDAGVKRVVMTSACAAATPLMDSPDSVTDETVWTDLTDRSLNAYRKSKVVAERAAWDFLNEHGGATEFTTILPGAVFGPMLSPDALGSVGVILRMLTGKMPGNPRVGFEVVDVRDLAEAHMRAMTCPEAAGERIIAAGEFMWTAEVSAALRDALGDAASKVPTRNVSDRMLKLAGRVDKGVRAILPTLGHKHVHSSAKAKRLLGWEARPGAECVVDCARDLIARGLTA